MEWDIISVQVKCVRPVEQLYIFPLALMGVLVPGSAHTRPSLSPLSKLAEIFWHMCLQSHLQMYPQPLRSHIWNFGTQEQLLKFSKKNFKKPESALPKGPGGVSEIFWGLISPFL
jgi:hypothetical protein